MVDHSFLSVTSATELQGKRVLLRASLNVPLEGTEVRNQFRLERMKKTIWYLTERGARVIVIGHIGRAPEETLRPVADALSKLLPLTFVPALTGEEVVTAIEALHDGEVLMLENLRSDARETENDDEFAKELASLADLYVNDAFADSHRAHASIVGIPKFIPSFAGLTFREEYDELAKSMEPVSPSLFLLGGAKFETKIPLVKKFLELYDHVFIGGALANDFFKAKGYEVGVSLVSSDPEIGAALHALQANDKIMLPVDVRVVKDGEVHITTPEEVEADEKIVDVGPATTNMLSLYIREAKTILWNGPLGYYEGGYDAETRAVAELVAGSSANSIIGGGDTVAVIEAEGSSGRFGFLSTAGGAMLTFLETGTLPGIDALVQK